MLNRNSIWIGLLLGLIMPALVYITLIEIFSILESKGLVSTKGFSENFRERTLGILGIAFNAVLLNIYRRRRWDLTMRGIVIGTGVLALAWLYVFGSKLI